MSAALVNRSLTTIRTELEFLKDSDVITEALYNQLVDSLPQKYTKDSKPKDIGTANSEKSTKSEVNYSQQAQITTNQSFKDQTNKIADELAKTSLTVAPPAYQPQPPNKEPIPVGYCTAIYDYGAQEADDLSLKKGDILAITEHLSEDWWKGYKSTDQSKKSGVFPSNYVKAVLEQEFQKSRKQVQPNPNLSQHNSYSSNNSYTNNYGGAPVPYGQMQPQPSYGGYAQYPPPSNYFPPAQPQTAVVPSDQPQQVQQQPQSNGNEHLKKYGARFGDGLAVGAGMGIASGVVNSIFN
ncbi:PIN3 [Candida jiufengensis]|uniref:PIN3 n=1 Tax=Candida jiufengensis TaxID=497108 RepID=UPI002224D7B5|nr:PIN3 [Candida jiufengensis]KAI5952546.1 PIN3 [Candida jiufengensis]